VQQPIEYKLAPTRVSVGLRGLMLAVKNVGTEDLIGLDAKLNSLDAYSIQT
jgi:hypothetical protein